MIEKLVATLPTQIHSCALADLSALADCAGSFNQSMGARNQPPC